MVLFGPAIWRVVSAGALMSMCSADARVERSVKIGTRCSSRTTGTRTCLSLYRYRFAFALKDGRPFVGWTRKGIVSHYRLGETVTVRYRPHNPGDITTDSPFYHWLVVVLFGALGNNTSGLLAQFTP